MKSRPNPAKRFFWTAVFDERLKAAYRAESRQELSRNLNHLERLTRFTRVVILSRAAELGLSFDRRRLWSSGEIEFVSENLGKLSITKIACKLRRTYCSVKAQVRRLNFSARVTEGYSQHEVIQLLGVGRGSVLEWIRRGWLEVVDGRISEASLARFVRRHPEEYRLNRVDEAWFKGLVFPSFGLKMEQKEASGGSSEGKASVSFSLNEIESITALQGPSGSYGQEVI